MFIALFAGWALPKTVVGSQLGLKEGPMGIIWTLICGIVAPAAVLVVFLASLFG
jgi:hypothetical protein